MKILKQLRLDNSYTLRQVEELTGISNAYLSQLENGKIKKPSLNVIGKLAIIYGVSIETIFTQQVGGKSKIELLEERLKLLEEQFRKIEVLKQVPFDQLVFKSTK